MTDKKAKKIPALPDRGRHEYSCRVCAHPKRDDIEREFVGWQSPAKIAAAHHIADRASIYRHAHARDLFSKRGRNLCAALDRIIERIDDVQVNGSAVMQAIIAHARINAQGQLVERTEQVISMHGLFARMTREELDAYAKDGTLPNWFREELAATGARPFEGDDDE